ncbi:MAG: hypothetical protein M1817_003905 [Caeruleum heppii]|nr:MAG: hypothetical protein M1817_003905 [Caeruleum heppii]
MLKEDSEERSSADYIHNEASKLLQRTRTTDTRGHGHTSPSTATDREDGGSITPKASMVNESADSEASTFRLNLQPPSSDGLEAPIRDTVGEPESDTDLIAGLGCRNSSLISSLVNSIDSEAEEQERSEAPDPDTQPRQALDTAQESMVDGLLWGSGSEAASLISHCDSGAKAAETEAGADEAQSKPNCPPGEGGEDTLPRSPPPLRRRSGRWGIRGATSDAQENLASGCDLTRVAPPVFH